MITLEKIYLENFISHHKSELVFDRGVIVLVGPNGSGKTSIIDAIYFALTGESRRGTKESLINSIAASRGNKAVVRLWIDVDGRKIFIERTISRRRGHEALLKVNGRIEARGVKEVDRAIQKILGISKKAIDTIMVIPQGRIAELLTVSPSERQVILDKLLGLDSYEEAFNKLKDTTIKINTKYIPPMEVNIVENKDSLLLNSYHVIINELSKIQAEIRKQLDNKAENEEKLKEVAKELENLISKQKKLEQHLGELREIENKIAMTQESIRRYNEELIKRKARLHEIEREIEKTEELRQEYKRLRPLADSLPILKELIGLEDSIREVLNNLKSAEEKISHYEKMKEEVQLIKSKYPEGVDRAREKYIKIKSMINELKDKLSQVKEEIARVSLSRQRDIEAIKKYKETLNKLVNEVSNLTSSKPSNINEAFEIISNEVINSTKVINELREKANEIKGRIRVSEQVKTESERKIELLKQSGRNQCPLCGQNLTEEKKFELIRRLSNEIEEAKSQIEELEISYSYLVDEIKAGEERLKILVETRARVEEGLKIYKEIENLKVHIMDYEGKLTSLNQQRVSIEKQLEQLMKEERKLSSIEEDYGKITQLLREGDPDELLNKARKELEAIRLKFNELMNRKLKLTNTVKEKLSISSLDLPSLITKAENAYSRINELREFVEKAEAMKSEAERLKVEIIDYENKVKKLEILLNSLFARKRELATTERELANVRESINELTGLRERLSEKIERIKEEIEKFRDIEKLLRDDARILRDAIFKFRVLMFLRENILHRNKVPAVIRSRSLLLIEKYMKKYLEYFNLAYSDVKTDETFGITLVAPGIEADVNSLSGGEVIAAAITALLALHNLVSKGRLGVLILDEPTIHLDVEKRRQLIEVLRAFKGGEIIPQLIIVTHQEEVRDAADYIFEVSRVGPYSKVVASEVLSIE